MSFMLKSPLEVMQDIAYKAKAKRLELNLTQQGLSVRSGVSLGTIKRFERFGEISLKSLIDIALTLGCMEDFEELFKNNQKPQSLFEKKSDQTRKRGTIKWD